MLKWFWLKNLFSKKPELSDLGPGNIFILKRKWKNWMLWKPHKNFLNIFEMVIIFPFMNQ